MSLRRLKLSTYKVVTPRGGGGGGRGGEGGCPSQLQFKVHHCTALLLHKVTSQYTFEQTCD
jgi:hypothetical protein